MTLENRISVGFDNDTKQQLQKIAEEKQWSLSQIVREAVKEYIKKEV